MNTPTKIGGIRFRGFPNFNRCAGFEEGDRHEVTAKNMPVACFLARGRIP